MGNWRDDFACWKRDRAEGRVRPRRLFLPNGRWLYVD
jgi:hypothetical protein